MTFSRRELFRRSLLFGTPSVLGTIAACGDDDPASDRPGEPGGDTGADTGLPTDVEDTTAPDAAPDAVDEPCEDGLPQYEHDGPLGPETVFSHGVASGDPLADAVILWTRVTTDAPGEVEVWYEIAEDSEFRCRVDVGWAPTDATVDHTVKLDLGGLRAGRTYYYRFFFQGRMSPVGRTRTTPEGDVERLRFAVCSCSSWAHGWFHAYRGIAERNDLDAVLHLGDYIYEYGTGQYGNRRPYDPPHPIVSLDDYRRRYAQYRTDENLQEVHRQHPFIVVWDDHESADNSWRDGAGNHNEATQGPWEDRKNAAIRAYKEWLPIRETEFGRVWRSFRYGTLVDLIMLDTRLWGRDEEGGRDSLEVHADPNRQLLGPDQEAWLDEQLSSSTARWRIIGQQVVVGTYRTTAWNDDAPGGIANPDQWDGYRAARERFFQMIEKADPGSTVVLTGDIHSSWAYNLAYDPNDPDSYNPETQEGSVAVEFVTPAISSPGFPRRVGPSVVRTTRQTNPSLRWAELTNRGYIVLDISTDAVQANWYHYEDVDSDDPTTYPEFFATAWATPWGSARLEERNEPSPPIADAPAPV